MPAHEFVEWMIYEGIEPFGDRRGDLQAGMICAMLANVNRTKKSDKVYGPMDFIPRWDAPPPKPQTPQQQFEMMKLLQGFQAARGNPIVKPD